MDEIGFVQDLNNANKMLVTFDPQTQDERVMLFRALNQPTYRLSDFINREICIRDLICEEVTLTNHDGVPTKAPRLVLIDTEGNSYNCISNGVYGAIQKLIMIFGMPTWQDGIKVKVVQINKGEKRMLNLELVD